VTVTRIAACTFPSPTFQTSEMSFTPTPSELAFVTQIFAQADSEKLPILSRDAALNIFAGAKLPPAVLGEIWSIADEDNNGWLPQERVAIVVRLLGWVQKGENSKVMRALINKRQYTCILMASIHR
jgi:epidermal growth factor receptor substrate 15